MNSHKTNLIYFLHYISWVCAGKVDEESLNANYPKEIENEVKKIMGKKYSATTHGPDALKATLFAVQICEKYDMSLQDYTKEHRDPREVADILTQIAMLRTRLNMRGFDHDDLHSGNIVINPGDPPEVRFIDLGLRKERQKFAALYNEFIRGTVLAQHVSMVDLLQIAMDGRDTAVRKLALPPMQSQ